MTGDTVMMTPLTRAALGALGALSALGALACDPATEEPDLAPAQDASTPPASDMGSEDQRRPVDAGADLIVAPEEMGGDQGGDRGGEACVETPIYSDKDKDGQGGEQVGSECLLPAQPPSNGELVRQGGDCEDDDPLRYVGSSGICGDRLDDDCDADDEMCPATQPASTLLPGWDCDDDQPPSNVYAWAKFDLGESTINPGCFVFFASGTDTFFVQRIGLDDTPSCTDPGGCVCQYDGGQGYDQRLYAFTRSDEAESCEAIQLGDGENVVSNACRKYLYHLYDDSRGYSFVAANQEALSERLAAFGTVEIACVKDVTFSGFPYQTILSAAVTLNPGFVKP